ncbi:MAG TPA: PIN domain-containing protein [Candidatus Desulfofervidus auxilii]|uniref:PIN domain-containing protein n=2 Tax=Desulfofervidus auxilii TaxID=1621989 RepID=A0A7C2A7V0_DESA2|nr:PIN domain-containing protein [Candidatus Desulfofervidus auxilii]
MDYATDTHSLVWYLTEDPLLSKKALKAFESTIREGIIIVPAVVLAEVMFISKKGKVTLTFEETLEKIEKYENFYIAPLDLDILKVADKIELDMEMHDKLIVATALCFGTTLITKDKLIRESGIVPTTW